jgi:cytochrome c
MIRSLAFLLATGAAIASAEGGDPAAGKVVFMQCAACHSLEETAAPKMGPHLDGLFGRAAGSLPDFTYSPAMTTSGIIWDDATFRQFIHNPQAFVPGTRMPFPGLRNDIQIDNLTAYLHQFDKQ